MSNHSTLSNQQSITLTSKALQQATRREYIDNYIDTDSYYHLGLTLTFNTDISRVKAEQHLRRCHQFINYKLLGRRWLTKDNIVHWIAFPEKWGVNPHYHLVVRLQREQVNDFLRNITWAWKQQIKSGTTDFIAVDDWTNYITKEWASLDDWIITEMWQ